MSDSPLDLAKELEELLPDALRTLFVSVPGDPFADLPVGQIRILRLLYRSDHSPKELATSLSISQPAVAQVLAKLEHQGLVEGHNLEHDRRCKLYRMTHNARQLMSERRNVRAQQAARVLADMPHDQRLALVAALRGLTQLKLPQETSDE